MQDKPKVIPPSGGSPSGVKIVFCACESEFQDRKYGEHQRVYNVGKGHTTCTSCGKRS